MTRELVIRTTVGDLRVVGRLLVGGVIARGVTLVSLLAALFAPVALGLSAGRALLGTHVRARCLTAQAEGHACGLCEPSLVHCNADAAFTRALNGAGWVPIQPRPLMC